MRCRRVVAFLVCLLAFSSSANAAGCPSGWTASTTVPGKCYAIAKGFDVSSLYYDYITGCQALQAGADIAAILNAFENAELAALLRSRNLEDAVIGYTIANGNTNWLSLTGYSNYTATNDNYEDYTYVASLEADTANWRGFDNAEQALCQYYPSNSSSWRPAPIQCPDGFLGSITQPDKCYYNYRVRAEQGETVSFADARQLCASLNAEIVTLNGADVEMLEVYWYLFGVDYTAQFTHINYVRSSATSTDWHWAGSRPANFTPTLAGTDIGTCGYVGNGMEYKRGVCGDETGVGYGLGVICELRPNQPSTARATTTSAAVTARTTTTERPVNATTTTTTAAGGSQCPNDWLSTSWSSTRKKCYGIVELTTAFERAHELCLLLHDRADMVAFAGADERQALRQELSLPDTETYWIGLQAVDGNDWQWTSAGGGPLNDAWAPGQPDTADYANHTCGALRAGQYLADDCWAATHKLLCQLTTL